MVEISVGQPSNFGIKSERTTPSTMPTSPPVRPSTIDSIRNGFRSALKAAKIEDFRFHDCRHTAITRMIQAGIPATETMKISGHTQFVTFARYVNVNEQAARKGAERLAEYIAEVGASESLAMVH